jgi:hypothetical protein
LSVADTASNIGQHIDALQALGDKLALVTLSDDAPIQLTQAQADAGAGVLDKILGPYSVEILT